MIKTLKLITFVISLLIFNNISAQSDNDKEQHLVNACLFNKDYQKAIRFIKSTFLKSDNDSRKVIGYVYLSMCYIQPNELDDKISALKKAREIAAKTKKEIDDAYVSWGYAVYYFDLGKYDLFLKSNNQSIKVFKKNPKENFLLSQLYFYKFLYKDKTLIKKDFKSDCIQSNQYAIKSQNNILINFTYNNLGYYYQKKYDETKNRLYLDSIKSNYLKSYEYARLIKDSDARKRSMMIYYLNIGVLCNYIYSDNGAQAVINYKKGLAVWDNDKKFEPTAALLYGNIGVVYESTGKYTEAEPYYLKAYTILSKYNSRQVNIKHRIIAIENMSLLYQKMKQYEKALEYEKEAMKVAQQENQIQFDNNTKSLELYYETKDKDNQIKQLRNQRLLYIITTILTLTFISFLLYFFYNRMKLNRQKINLLKAEKKNAELILKLENEEKRHLQYEQEKLQKQTLAVTLELDHKNNFITDIKEKIKEIKDDKDLKKIIKNEKSISNDLSEIQNIAQEIHPSFFRKLNELSKNKLTKQDVKYATYIYMDLDNLQIANILKVDPNTVRKTKYRLKQKLGLIKEDDLRLFLQNLA